MPLAKELVIDLTNIPGMPDKIEGIAQVNGNTLAVANDNDYDIGTFNVNGHNQGAGIKSRILLIEHAPLKAQDSR